LFDGSSVRLNGFAELAAIFECIAELVVRCRKVRTQLERPAVRDYGFIEPVERVVGFAKIGMSDGIIRIENDGIADRLDREVVAADLESHDAEQVECVGIVWLYRKNLAVKGLSVRQAASLVVLNRNFERLLNRHGGGMENGRWSGCRIVAHGRLPGAPSLPHRAVGGFHISRKARRVHEHGIFHPITKG